MIITDYNSYYRDYQKKFPKKKTPVNVLKFNYYNRIAVKTKNQLKGILVYSQFHPPEEWEWIFVDGHETASWIIWLSKSESWSINLSAIDGKLYSVNSAGEPLSNANVCIEEIDNMSQVLNVRGECTIFDISNSISERRNILWPQTDADSAEVPDEDFEKKAKKYHSSK